MTYSGTLLIDIDDTLIRQVDVPGETYSLLRLIREKAKKVGSDGDWIAQKIRDVFKEVYWNWGNFLDALQIEKTAFWKMADSQEAKRTTLVDDDIFARLTRLRAMGYRLIITSNNPVDGIEHKLRLAGINSLAQKHLFSAFFGTDNCRANKSQLTFWKHVMNELKTPCEEISVVGDNPVEDGELPKRLGVKHWFPIVSETNGLNADSTWVSVERQLVLRVDFAHRYTKETV